MRYLFIGLLCLMGLNCQRALALVCLSGESTYQVILSEDKTTAQVLNNFESVRFGILSCSPILIESDPNVELQCRSVDVADAGFEATFFAERESNSVSVVLSEITFVGAKSIANLSCIDSMGTLQKRVLWITGEGNVEGIDVAAGGEIEINIKTTSGTGYSWELQKPLIPETITLIEGPFFIPNTELMGGVGVTRFRFRVVPNPNRGFTLFFQLRRPWEETPLKQFYVRFNAIRESMGKKKR